MVRLNLNKQRASAIPPMVCQLKHLTSLNLRRNNLVELPREFGDLLQLRFLTLSFNRLQSLPGKFAHMNEPNNQYFTNYHRRASFFLCLTGYFLLTDTFGQLTNLSMLDLHSNKLIKLPDSFVHLSKLVTVVHGSFLHISIPSLTATSYLYRSI